MKKFLPLAAAFVIFLAAVIFVLTPVKSEIKTNPSVSAVPTAAPQISAFPTVISTVSSSSDQKLYQNSQYGFSFNYSGLELTDSQGQDLNLKLTSVNNGILTMTTSLLDKPTTAKDYVATMNQNYYLECGRRGCTGGSSYKTIGKTVIGGAPAVITTYKSPHLLNGAQLAYFMVKDNVAFEIDMEFNTDQYSTAPIYQTFKNVLSSFTFTN